MTRPAARYSPALALVAAVALDILLGDPRRLHPVSGFGRLAERAERALWRDSRLCGASYAALLIVSTTAAVAGLEQSLRPRPRARTVFAAAALWSTLGGRSLWRYARMLASAVADGELDRARALAPALVGRDPTGLGGAELCRAAVESVAENTTDAIVAPLAWFAACGAPGAAAYRAVNTLDAMVGHRSPRYAAFGWASARLDDALTWPCARIATGLVVALAPVVGGSRRETLRALRTAGEHPSPNAGLIEAAFAGALAVRLGGRNAYAGRVERRPMLGSGDLPGPADVKRAVRLSCALTLTTMSSALIVRALLP